MIMKLLGRKDYLRVLHAVERKPMRFFQLQLDLGLHPPQVDRAVKYLCAGGWIKVGAADTATGLPLTVYTLTDRGAALLEAFMLFAQAVNKRRSRLGRGAFVDVRDCWT